MDDVWRLDKDGHRVDHAKGTTQCWAEVQPGVFCSIETADPLGLCERHRREVVGRKDQGR